MVPETFEHSRHVPDAALDGQVLRGGVDRAGDLPRSRNARPCPDPRQLGFAGRIDHHVAQRFLTTRTPALGMQIVIPAIVVLLGPGPLTLVAPLVVSISCTPWVLLRALNTRRAALLNGEG